MIELTSVSKVFGMKDIETHALKNVTFRINKGEMAAITGPSGSGKSTLLSILGLLEPPSNGEYVLDGVRTVDMNDRERSQLRNEKIGFVFQGFNLVSDMSLHDNVSLPLRYRGISAQERNLRVREALEQVGLASRSSHLPSQISGGQQQRAAIARAICGRPELILADEPTGNLDSEMSVEIMSLLKRLNSEGTTVLIVTHDVAIASSAPRRIHILDGRMMPAIPA